MNSSYGRFKNVCRNKKKNPPHEKPHTLSQPTTLQALPSELQSLSPSVPFEESDALPKTAPGDHHHISNSIQLKENIYRWVDPHQKNGDDTVNWVLWFLWQRSIHRSILRISFQDSRITFFPDYTVVHIMATSELTLKQNMMQFNSWITGSLDTNYYMSITPCTISSASKTPLILHLILT